MRARVVYLSLLLGSLPACSLSRSVIGGTGPGNDASVDAMGIDAFRVDAGPDTGVDANLPDTGMPDMGVDAYVPPDDTGVDGGNDAGNDAYVPPVDAGSDAGPCALCTGSQMCCSLACVDPTNDVNHCGSCDPCAAASHATSACVSSTCTISMCATGFADCNTSYTDGCETPLGTVTDCASCGDACATYANTTSACGGTSCTYTCDAGYTSCNAASPDCETHTDVDANNCGACGHVCLAGQTCSAGACHGWGTMPTTGAPSGRSQHTAVWTGSVMIVWGGTNAGGELNTGGRYDPVTNTWAATSTTGAPGGRRGHAAVWTGSRMVVWGGYRGGTGWLNDAAAYDPVTDTWTALPSGGAPAGRSRFAYAWDDVDDELIVFGGWTDTTGLGAPVLASDAATYDLTAWSGTSDPALTARYYLPGTWAGSRFVVWGGEQPNGNVFNTGAVYNVGTNTWSAIATGGRPSGRSRQIAVSTGSVVIMWSGWSGTAVRADGARYTVSSDTWANMAAAPSGFGGRVSSAGVWSGTEMFVFGGVDDPNFGFGTTYMNDAAAYAPGANTWRALSGTNAPSGRGDHTAVWSSAGMIVWGGRNATMSLGDGAVYAD